MLLSLLCVFNIYSQEINLNKDDLLGEWCSYKVTTLEGGDGSELTFDGKPFDKKVIMTFIDSKTMLFSIDESEEYRVEYSIKNNKITIVHREYLVEEITKDKLVLKELKVLGNLIYMKKDDS